MGNCTKTSKKQKQKPTQRQKQQVVEPVSAYSDCSPVRNICSQKNPITDDKLRSSSVKNIQLAQIPGHHKSTKDRQIIMNALKSHSLFNSLKNVQLETILIAMKRYSFSANLDICVQGEPGQHFFIVAKGSVEVIVNKTLRSTLQVGHSFGELALYHNTKRTATVRSVGNVILWGIDRESFLDGLNLVNEKYTKENKRFIEHIALFKVLSPVQKERVLSAIVTNIYMDNQTVLVEGDPGELFYIITDGEARCTLKNKELRRLGPGDYFGEQALLYQTERTATVTAIGTLQVISLGKNDLVQAFGDQLQHIIYKNTIRIAIERSHAFKKLTDYQINSMLELIKVKSFLKGRVVIKKGTSMTNTLWIVLNGSTGNNSEVYQYYDCLNQDEFMQQQAIQFEQDLRALENTDIAQISQTQFCECIGGSLTCIKDENRAIIALSNVNLLRSLSRYTIERLTGLLKIFIFSSGETVFCRGDPGDCFFIVKQGQVSVIIEDSEVRVIGKNDYFGERALLLNKQRTATVQAKTPVVLWSLSRLDFEDFVDYNLRKQLQKRMELQNDSVQLSELRIIKLLGKGLIGNVFLAVHCSTKVMYALKSVQRAKVELHDIFDQIEHQRMISLQMDHPFIIKLVKTFKDEKRLYFLMELVLGGNLFDVLRIMNLLNDESAKFYTACIVLILEHLHEKNIIFRDLKPENIMIDQEGYPKLIDFGTAKIVQGRTNTNIGTPHYMAPEIIAGDGYSISADYYSLGVMLYEFLCGCTPFGEDEQDPMKIYQKVMQNNLIYPSFVREKILCKPLIEELLSKVPATRGTYQTIKLNQWFKKIDWEAFLAKRLETPYIPKIKDMDEEIQRALNLGLDASRMINSEESRDIKNIMRPKGQVSRNWDDYLNNS